MSKFKINEVKSGNGIVLELSGVIDEDVVFLAEDYGEHAAVVVDFAGVTAINSCGIREWMKFLAELPPATPVIYRNCPKVIVDQMNFIDGFVREGVTVESFQVPYYCESCDKVTVLKVEKEKDYPEGKFAPAETIPCASCGKPAELDVLEDKYFKFMGPRG